MSNYIQPTVKLLDCTQIDPAVLASLAGKTAYNAELPALDGKMLDVEGKLFGTGHHTTLEHASFVFAIDGLSVSAVTFGLHLNHPFYNTDQRSGRYCAKMFLEPNFENIEGYLRYFWPELSEENVKLAMDYVKQSVAVYHKNISAAEELAQKYFAVERPFASKTVKDNAKKIAQEQLRMFIPTIFPTGLQYTCDLITIVSMWLVAWSPEMRFVTDKMKDLVLGKYPSLGFIFNESERLKVDWHPKIPLFVVGVKHKPECSILEKCDAMSVDIDPAHLGPTDLLPFAPQYMNNNVALLKTSVHISVATMGQDQRHRTIHRCSPEFSGSFYLPPLLDEMGLEEEMMKMSSQWIDVLRKVLPKTLLTALAPYGAMVRYRKSTNLNAFAHEQAKRLCWCAQEEIYHLNRILYFIADTKAPGIRELMMPPCSKGKCAEAKGGRYCGRCLSKVRKSGEFLLERKV
ncbi:MAG: FAD-dependent thymidylate synthase [Minisyncoccia bacterium]